VSALQHFRAPGGLAPGPGYSHAVTGRGRWVAISGQVALDGEGKLVGPGDPRGTDPAGVRQPGPGAGCGRRVVHRRDQAQLLRDRHRDAPGGPDHRDEYVDTARPPASTAVQVTALAMPDLMIEIEAWAVCAD
jgi:enamine deaminase RidA (YjgF/YER057c/UK114 family)